MNDLSSAVEVDEVDPAKVAQIEKAMTEAGTALDTPVIVDYFDFDETHRVMLPDGIQYVDHKELTEGQRKEYLNATNRSVRIRKVTGDAEMATQPGNDRHVLLSLAIVGWSLKRRDPRSGQVVDVPFGTKSKAEMLDSFPPRIIDLIDKDVRKHNPWLLAEMSVEDMERERDSLNEMIETKKNEEAGKAS